MWAWGLRYRAEVKKAQISRLPPRGLAFMLTEGTIHAFKAEILPTLLPSYDAMNYNS